MRLLACIAAVSFLFLATLLGCDNASKKGGPAPGTGGGAAGAVQNKEKTTVNETQNDFLKKSKKKAIPPDVID